MRGLVEIDFERFSALGVFGGSHPPLTSRDDKDDNSSGNEDTERANISLGCDPREFQTYTPVTTAGTASVRT